MSPRGDQVHARHAFRREGIVKDGIQQVQVEFAADVSFPAQMRKIGNGAGDIQHALFLAARTLRDPQ